MFLQQWGSLFYDHQSHWLCHPVPPGAAQSLWMCERRGEKVRLLCCCRKFGCLIVCPNLEDYFNDCHGLFWFHSFSLSSRRHAGKTEINRMCWWRQKQGPKVATCDRNDRYKPPGGVPSMVAPRFNLMLKGGSSFVFQQKITTADVSIDTDWLRETAPAAFNHRQSLWRQVQVQGLKQWCVSIYRTAAWMLVLESRTLCWNFWSGWTRPFLLSPVCRDLRSWLFFNVVLTLHFMEHFRSYATTESLQRHGGVYLRPWHLPFSPSAGLKGLLEPEAWIQAPNECMDVSIFKLGCIKAFQLTC